ncbi:MAG: DHH family phosphoesterase [Clostridia bacterium]|nr:DHH family phosphoesterase [Clostridia bacterium]
MSKRKVMTTYVCPDVDGIGAMYAYAELLRKNGEDAGYYYEGKLKKEAEIILNLFNIKLSPFDLVEEDDDIIMIDNNELNFLPKCIKKEKIVEIIDHHVRCNWIDEFPNIKCQIEFIGAAATLVAERYKSTGKIPSREAAILMYYGIISNTMNLKIKMTTNRDIEMAEWLKSLVPEINDNITRAIFIKKSEIGDNLEEEMEIGFKNRFVTIKWSIGQLEVANADEFIEKYYKDIQEIMDRVSKENDIDYISTNVMDVLNGYNVLIAGNERTKEMIEENFDDLRFENMKAKSEKFYSRKEIVRVIAEKYKSDK